MAKISAKQLKIAGLIPLLIPIALFLMLTVGEIVGGDISGLGGLVLPAQLVILAIFAWKKPDLGGKILVVISILLLIIVLAPQVLYRVEGGMGIESSVVGVWLLLYVPPIISGLLFIASARKGS